MLINKIRKNLIAAVIFSLLFVIQNNAQEKRQLTLDESLKIGLENSKTLHSSRLKIISSEAQLSQANAAGLPSLGIGATYTRLSNVDPYNITIPGMGSFTVSPSILDNYTAKVTLQQPLFTGFKISSNYDIAQNNALAVKQDYSKDEQDVIYNVKNAYWNLFLAGKLKEAIDENVQQMKAHLEDIQNFFKQGLATKNEVLKVEVQLSEAQLSQIDARNSVKIATVNFDNVINIPLSTEIEIQKEVLVENENIEDIDQLIDKAMKNRPDLKSLQYKLNASKNGITLAQSGWFPQVVLAGEYDYSKPNSRILPVENKFNGTWAINLGLTYNLWDWGTTKAQTTQAESQYEQTKDSYSTLKDAVTLDVTQNYYNLIKAKEKVLVTQQTVSQAEENYRVTDDKFRQGLTLNSELLDAEVALVQAKTNNAQSIADYELAKAQIERSTGGK
ncbi:MAG: TolC family protein [Ignavibacteriaceae bacterium]|nr:TolC family protein [Ignavibacteriaceae bacterium]